MAIPNGKLFIPNLPEITITNNKRVLQGVPNEDCTQSINHLDRSSQNNQGWKRPSFNKPKLKRKDQKKTFAQRNDFARLRCTNMDEHWPASCYHNTSEDMARHKFTNRGHVPRIIPVLKETQRKNENPKGQLSIFLKDLSSQCI